MSTGAKKDAQTRMDQSGGGQMTGGIKSVNKAEVSKFLGKSGTGDNQSTSRGKGRT